MKALPILRRQAASCAMIPLANQLACVQRQTEKMRRRFAIKSREGARINRFAWENEIKNMEAVCETLQKMAWLAEVSEEIKAMNSGAESVPLAAVEELQEVEA